jgi:phospholipase/carboxylesterase
MKLLHTAHVPAGDGPFPTILALHGWGANGHDLLGLAPYLHSGRLLVLCPQGSTSVPLGGGMAGYGWFPLVPGVPPNPVEFAQASVGLREFLDQAVAAYPVDRKRLVVAGFSQGGVMAYDLALRQPERFRGLAALSSWLPEPLAAALPAHDGRRDFPVLLQHGTEDSLVEIEKARQSRRLLEEMGTRLTYREYPMAHEIRPEGLRDLDSWLTEILVVP